MSYLNYKIEELESNGGFHTAKEINNQPRLWRETLLIFLNDIDKISKFLEGFLKKSSANVILTGAGSSAFVGESLQGTMQKTWEIPCRAVATTDIVTHPEYFFIHDRPTLLISFARSGNSPESIHAIKLAKQHCNKLYEINITCNRDGELAKSSTGENSYLFLLPDETNDQSLAMTSSFSSMLLAGLLITNYLKANALESIIGKVVKMGQYVLDECLPVLEKIAGANVGRMVFLGSGPLFGIAHESHLKVQELSDGQVICKFDSFLGFRHGPKAVVNDSTMVVYLFTNNRYSNLYEFDLVRSVKETGAGELSVAIGRGFEKETDLSFDYSLKFPAETDEVPEEFLSLPYIMPAQIIGFLKSLKLGLKPDSPSIKQSISRVVKGVIIYSKTVD